ncbi:MAG: Bug family tripartite tricarboxylate transporter substrate binding protein [Gemmobacter sp.]
MTHTTITRRGVLGAAAAAGALLGLPQGLRAQAAWPEKPVTLILGFPPGGGLDTYVRLLSPFLSEVLGQPVQVENRTGASGNIGTEYVVNADPDGYTILFSTASAMAAASHAFPDLAFDPIADLDHISLATESSYVLLASKELAANTWDEFVALAQSQPGGIVHACAGVGSVNHLIGELISIRSGIQLNTVQYKGGGPALTDLLANQAQVMTISVGQAEPYISSGQLKGLLVCAPTRAKPLPDVPASLEFGIKDLDRMTFWISASAPKGTPGPVLDAFQAALAKCYQNPDLVSRMQASGLTPVASSRADFAAKLAADHALYGEIFTAANIKV